MNKELGEKWADALESGKYKQGYFALRSCDDEFCCLGVLCDVVDPKGWSYRVNSVNFHYHDPEDPVNGRSGFLPKFITRALGITPNEEQEFTDMNDTHDMTFEQIAAHIRERIK